ncbi:MAG: DNA polymerase/3'-5' exonuclease PolX [Deltaproteobacteria bacterium]|nr:DNA polymerase/3'-5' exonuclease PolX [Deltaproteobacteria bacterium]
MENIEIARVFHEVADLLEIKGENLFRIRSYRNAALVIEGLPLSIKDIAAKGLDALEAIPGIGRSIAEKIEELFKSGRCAYHDELLKEYPHGVLTMLKVSGVGPKKAGLFYKTLGIKSIEELLRAAREGRLNSLPGVGVKTEDRIKRSIEELKAVSGRFSIWEVFSEAVQLTGYMKSLDGCIECMPAGSLRRWKETIGDLDILAVCKKAAPIMDHFTSYPLLKEVIAKGGTLSTIILRSGLQVDLRVVDLSSFGAALQYFTGSKAHNIVLRERARKMGLKINEYGVFREIDDKRIAGRTEEDVYSSVGLPFIPPELRENTGEIEAAEEGRLPKLVEAEDIRGDLHIHTSESDGAATIEEMAEAAISMGYEYIAITEHSRALGVAHGLDEKRLLRHIKAIDALNAKLKKKGSCFRVIKGAEVDIRSDGSLDYDEKTLKQLDCVVAAVHSGFAMTKEEMTARIIKAVSSGFVHILAHPTGRLIGSRGPYPIDMEAVLDMAAKHNVVMELNSYPERLDLNDMHLKLAKTRAVLVVISTDSHNPGHLKNIAFGVHIARRAWLEKKDILNTKPLKEVLRLFKKTRV